MHDGVRLDTNIYFPKIINKTYPSILMRSPYPEPVILDAEADFLGLLLRHGYVIIFQYERGRYWSEGDSNFMGNAKDDGYDTIEWIVNQDWSNGAVGTYGCSSSAENQLSLSVANHPAHRAAVAQAPGAGIGCIGPFAEQGNVFRGGALQLFFASWFKDHMIYGGRGAHLRPQFPAELTQAERIDVASRFDLGKSSASKDTLAAFDHLNYYQHLPVTEINHAVGAGLTDWDDFSRRTPGDNTWASLDFVNQGDALAVPMLWVFSWYDIAVAPNVLFYRNACASAVGRGCGNQHMIIGPMSHCQFGRETEQTKIGDRDIGDARFDYHQRYLEWFDYWLKDTDHKLLNHPSVFYYQMGANRWIAGSSFPPTAKTAVFYLDSQGHANSRQGDGLLRDTPVTQMQQDTFVYDPQYPVPTLGGGACCMGDIPSEGSFDQSALEMRNDVLVYSSPPLTEALSITGFVEVYLYVSSSVRDTDFTLKLVDVYPDGRAYNLDDSIFRARYREGYDRSVFMKEGEVYELRFPPLVTGNTFQVGHCIRLEVSSSNFPRYDRNLNTGGNNFDEKGTVVAINTIHHSPDFLSRIVIHPLDKAS